MPVPSSVQWYSSMHPRGYAQFWNAPLKVAELAHDLGIRILEDRKDLVLVGDKIREGCHIKGGAYDCFIVEEYGFHPVIYSSTGAAYKGGSEGKTNKGGSPVVQGWKDRSLGMRRDTGEMRREGLREVSDTGDSGTARGLVMRSAKARGYRDWHTTHTTCGEGREKTERTRAKTKVRARAGVSKDRDEGEGESESEG
jgi:hypothetical protein